MYVYTYVHTHTGGGDMYALQERLILLTRSVNELQNMAQDSQADRDQVLQHTATHCNTLQRTATHCSILQHTATHCNTLQYTATHCSALTCGSWILCDTLLREIGMFCDCVCAFLHMVRDCVYICFVNAARREIYVVRDRGSRLCIGFVNAARRIVRVCGSWLCMWFVNGVRRIVRDRYVRFETVCMCVNMVRECSATDCEIDVLRDWCSLLRVYMSRGCGL